MIMSPAEGTIWSPLREANESVEKGDLSRTSYLSRELSSAETFS
jgi:hypothetical protein